MPSLQVVSLVASILCPIITALVMWGYKSDQKGLRDTIQQIADKCAEGIAKNSASIEKVAARHAERMDKIEANFNDLKADLPFVYVLREDFVRSLNNVDKRMTDISGKLDKLMEKL